MNNLVNEIKQGSHTPDSIIREYSELVSLFDNEGYELDPQVASVGCLLIGWIESGMTEDSHVTINQIISTWYGVELITPQSLTFSFIIFFAYLDDYFTDAPLAITEVPALIAELMAQHFVHISFFQDASPEFKDFPSARLLVLRSLLHIKDNHVIQASDIDLSNPLYGLVIDEYFVKSKEQEEAEELLKTLMG
jgi:hypothetical protein